MSRYAAVLSMPCAALGIVVDHHCLVGIDFLPVGHPAYEPAAGDRWAWRIYHQLEAYLRDPAVQFDVPINPRGTPFQRRVWHAMSGIPRGETLTYGALAASLGSGARAVANACGANPLPIVIPCHRVVSASGLGGFMGGREAWALEIKQWLLLHERSRSAVAG